MSNITEKLAHALAMADEPAMTDETGDDAARENVALFPSADTFQHLRIVEAILFAAADPVDERSLADRLPAGADVQALLGQLAEQYRGRGVNLVRVANKWSFRTAEDLSFIMRRDAVEQKRLSRAALETLSIIAYHQPVTRSEIEEVRGVSISKGTLDALLEIGWIRMRGRRRAPGRPVTYGTTEDFLSHFGLEEIRDLPGLSDLRAAGLLDGNLPPDFVVPEPQDGEGLTEDEDPLEEGDLAHLEEFPYDADEETDDDAQDGAEADDE